jgi:hypothetical protein
VLGPNAKLRSRVVPPGPFEQEKPATEADSAAECEVDTVQVRPQRVCWARLLKRVFDVDMRICPNCGVWELKIIAAILERPVIENILSHLGLDPQPPPRGRPREPWPHCATRVAPAIKCTSRWAALKRCRWGGAAPDVGKSLSAARSTLRPRPEPTLLSSQGPRESARSDRAGPYAQQSWPLKAGSGLVLGVPEGV